MSGGHGHGHDAEHAGHADHGGHGHGAGTATASSGPHEIPPMPAHPFISPARAEYEQPWPGRLLLWPFFWAAFAVLCFVSTRTWSHPVIQGEHGHADEHGAGHGAPKGLPAEPGAHGTPAMGEHTR